MKPSEILVTAALVKKEVAKALSDNTYKSLADMAVTIKGDNGEPGQDGKDGKDGIDGINGKNGAQGQPGRDGKDGVSIVGPKGDTGKQGPKGNTGTKGDTGQRGVGVRDAWIDPENGHLYVELTDGRVIDCGKAKGDDGKDGKNGRVIHSGGGSSAGTGPGGPASWGTITGNIDSQADLIAALAEKQDIIDAFSGSWDDLEDVPMPLANTTAAFTSAQQTKLSGVANGATANSADATLLARANHTGTQAQSTVTNLTTDLAAKAPLASPTFTGTVTLPDGQVVNGVTLTTAGGTTNFLRADGTYAAPPGGDGGVSDGDKGDVAVSGGGTVWTVEGAAGNFTVGGYHQLPAITTPATPPAGNLRMFAKSVAGRMLPEIIGPSGIDTALQPFLGSNRVGMFMPNGNSGTSTSFGIGYSTTGSVTTANVTTTNRFTRMRGIEYLVTTAVTTAVVGFRGAVNQWTIGASTAGDGGFLSVLRWGPATGVETTTTRALAGMRVVTTPTDVETSTIVNMVGMGWDAADANIQIMHNDGSGTATKINLGAAFPVPTVNRTSVYEIALFSPPGTTQSVGYRVTDLVSGAEASGTITTDIPGTGTLIAPVAQMSVGGTSSVVGIKIFSHYIETDY